VKSDDLFMYKNDFCITHCKIIDIYFIISIISVINEKVICNYSLELGKGGSYGDSGCLLLDVWAHL